MAKRRDIFLARIFFSDSPQEKIRPCIVLTSEAHNGGGYMSVAAITTANDECCLAIGKNDASCALAEGSHARFDAIFRVKNEDAIRKIGAASGSFYEKLSGAMAELIGK